MKKKNAVSFIVSVVLFILISFIIAGIIFSFSQAFIKKQQAQAQANNFYYGADMFVLSELATGGGGPLPELQLGVRRTDNEGNIQGIRFNIKDNKGSSYTYDFYENPPNTPGIIHNYNLNLNEKNIDVEDIEKISVKFLYEKNKETGVLDLMELK